MARRWANKFLTALEETANVTKSAELAGITRQTAYYYRRESADFAEAWDRALLMGVGTLEDEAVRRAVSGVDEPIFYKGDMVGTVRKYSDTLLIFLLKAHKPERYNPVTRSEVTGKDGGAIQMQVEPFAGMSDDDLDRFIATHRG